MSQQLKEFVNQSGVEVSPSSASTTASNNNLAGNIEANMLRRQEFPNRLEKNMMSNANYNEFSDAINSNWNRDANYNKLPNENKKMINNILSEFEPPVPVPIPPRNIELSFSKLNPGMFNVQCKKGSPIHANTGSVVT